MSKIGILGGTFNPVHNAHLCVAETAFHAFSLDRVWLMPSGKPPHKDDKELASSVHRCNMIEAAIRGRDCFALCDYEVKTVNAARFSTESKVNSYTFETLEALGRRYPQHQFYFIIGGDSLLRFEHWREPERIVRLATILACGRAGCDNTRITEKISELNQRFDCEIKYFEAPSMEISSRAIRAKFYEKAPVFDTSTDEKTYPLMDELPYAVFHYIQKNKLYQGKEKRSL